MHSMHSILSSGLVDCLHLSSCCFLSLVAASVSVFLGFACAPVMFHHNYHRVYVIPCQSDILCYHIVCYYYITEDGRFWFCDFTMGDSGFYGGDKKKGMVVSGTGKNEL